MPSGQQIGEAFVRIRPKTDTFGKEVADQTKAKTKPVNVPVDPKPAPQFNESMRKVAGLAAGLFAAAAVKNFIVGGLDELKEQERVAAQTNATIKATGGAAKVSAAEVSGLASALQDLSGKDAEAIQAGENLLLTFKGVRNEAGAGNDIFNQATKAALDLSVAFGTDMSGASILLGKALDDPVRGLTALRKMGVGFTEDQKALITSLVASGDKLSAQKIILKELESQVGGSAEAYGTTLPGKLERANNALDDFKASVVGGAAPALELLAQGGTAAVGALDALPDGLQTVVIASLALAAASGPLSRGLTTAKEAVAGLRQSVSESGRDFAASAARATAYAAAIALVHNFTQDLIATSQQVSSDIFKDVNFSDLEKNSAALDKSKQKIEGLQRQWDEYNRVEQLAHISEGKSLNDAIAQYEVYAQRQNANIDLVARLALETGHTADETARLVSELKIDPSSVPFAKLVLLLQEFERNGGNAADAATTLGIEIDQTAGEMDGAGNSAKDLSDDLFKLVDAQNAAADGADRVADAQRSAERAAQRLTDAQRSYQDALQGIADAQFDLVRSNEQISDAKFDQRRAERDLAEARAEGDPKKIEDAERSLLQAQRGVRDAQHDAAAAVRAVTEAHVRAEAASRAITDAQTDQAKATKDIERAQLDQVKSQEALNELTKKDAEGNHATNEELGKKKAYYEAQMQLFPQLIPVYERLIELINAETQANTDNAAVASARAKAQELLDRARKAVEEAQHKVVEEATKRKAEQPTSGTTTTTTPNQAGPPTTSQGNAAVGNSFVFHIKADDPEGAADAVVNRINFGRLLV